MRSVVFHRLVLLGTFLFWLGTQAVAAQVSPDATTSANGTGTTVPIPTIDVSQDEFLSHATHRPLPLYPPLAKAAMAEGVVVLELLVGIDGKVESVRRVSSVPLLEYAAAEGATEWTFTPFEQNGRAVKGRGNLSFTFESGVVWPPTVSTREERDCRTLAAARRWLEAEASCRAFIASRPEPGLRARTTALAIAHHSVGAAMLTKSDFESAATSLEEARRLQGRVRGINPVFGAQSTMLLAAAYELKGEAGKARSVYRASQNLFVSWLKAVQPNLQATAARDAVVLLEEQIRALTAAGRTEGANRMQAVATEIQKQFVK